MPINRGPFNSLIDDNGSGLTGSIWNKAAIQSVLLDPIDAAATTGTTTVAVGTTDVVFETPNAQIHYVRVFAQGTDITIRSMPLMPMGTMAILENIGTNNVWLTHLAAGVAAGTELRNRLTSMATPLAPGGCAIYVHEYQNSSWYLAAHDQGKMIVVPYSAANFIGGGATTWTVTAGNRIEQSYFITGNVAHVRVNVVASTITGSASTTLAVVFPSLAFANYTSASGFPGFTSLGVGGAWGLCQGYPISGNSLGLIRPDYVAWPNTAGVGYFGFGGSFLLV